MLIPFITTLSVISWARGCILIANSNGDSAQPCLHPRSNLKALDLCLLTLVEACGLEYKVCTHLRKVGPK